MPQLSPSSLFQLASTAIDPISMALDGAGTVMNMFNDSAGSENKKQSGKGNSIDVDDVKKVAEVAMLLV